ncbi:MAG: hypothetical protein ACLR01_10505 [Vescimonas sp.]
MQFTGLVDHYPAPMACKELDVALSWLERRLGKPLTQEDVSHKLGLLGFTTSFSGDTMHVTVPSWRSTGDVSHSGGHHGGGRPDVRLRELRGRPHHHLLRRGHQPAG